MDIASMIIDNNFTSEAREHILSSIDVADNSEFVLSAFLKVCLSLLRAKPESDFDERVLRIFPEPNIVSSLNLFMRYMFESFAPIKYPDDVKRYMNTFILVNNFEGYVVWAEMQGDKEQFILGMLKNGAWTYEFLQELWDAIAENFFVDDLIDFKRIADKHPEWGIKFDIDFSCIPKIDGSNVFCEQLAEKYE